MKITSSILAFYYEKEGINKLLRDKVEESFISIKQEKRWLYYSRIKLPESFALKLETGREIDDFFACTLVVESQNEIKEALKRIKKFFKIIKRRPLNDTDTHKDPESFPFDDLRLYVSLKKDPTLPTGPINDVIFELQVKTFFQHAWAITTHDLVYKSDEINWTKKRVAYQIKAMLENAEITILKAGKIKKISGLPEQNNKLKELNEVKNFILKNWSSEQLPTDLIRLTENISLLMKIFNIKLDALSEILKKEFDIGRGVLTGHLSPYLVIVQSIIFQKPSAVKKFIENTYPKEKRKIFLPREIDLTSLGYDQDKLINSRRIVIL
jgi:ppGpp synthetase/RelA/SpoT-type nucleotidyltranferase